MAEEKSKYSNIRRTLVPIVCNDRPFMNVFERNILRHFYAEKLVNVSPLPLARTLSDEGHIPNECYLFLVNKEEKSPFSFSYDLLLTEIEKKFSLKYFVYLLFTVDFSLLANDLIVYYTEVTRTQVAPLIIRTPSGNRKNIQRYFKSIKKQVHEFAFKNPQADLNLIGEKFRNDMANETNSLRRRYACDRYIALKAAEIDALTNRTDDIDPNGKCFREIEDTLAESSNPAISRVLLYGRKADILSSLGRVDEGKDALKEAFGFANMTNTCLEIIDMVYKSVVFRLAEFESNPTDEIRELLITEASRGLEGLDNEDEDVRIFWKRLFILRIIYCHLGIGKRCKIIPNYDIPASSIQEAERLLTQDPLHDLEHRRQMMYGVAKARIYELKGNLKMALTIIEEAFNIGKEGQYTETPVIQEYQSYLNSKIS